MFGCILMWLFISNETSVVSILYGTIAMFLLFGAIEFWEKKLKEWFKMEDRKKIITKTLGLKKRWGLSLIGTHLFYFYFVYI